LKRGCESEVDARELSLRLLVIASGIVASNIRKELDMANISVGLSAEFECPKCGESSFTDPGIYTGLTVVCEHCGATHKVADVGYQMIDWNKRNRKLAKENSGQMSR
jgi:transcription elongation factor Elf1